MEEFSFPDECFVLEFLIDDALVLVLLARLLLYVFLGFGGGTLLAEDDEGSACEDFELFGNVLEVVVFVSTVTAVEELAVAVLSASSMPANIFANSLSTSTYVSSSLLVPLLLAFRLRLSHFSPLALSASSNIDFGGVFNNELSAFLSGVSTPPPQLAEEFLRIELQIVLRTPTFIRAPKYNIVRYNSIGTFS
jgi:hypothetical protein